MEEKEKNLLSSCVKAEVSVLDASSITVLMASMHVKRH